MTQDIEVAATAVDTGAETGTPAAAPYFSVSTSKLAVMWFCSLSLYSLYWFYKHWTLIREREKSDIMPVMRAIFPIFFAHSLIDRINKHAASLGMRIADDATVMAAGFIITQLLSRLPEPWFLIFMLGIFFLLPAQGLANAINAKVAPDAPVNDRYSGANWVMIVIGGLMLLLAILGSMPDSALDPATQPAEPEQSTSSHRPL